MLHSDSWAMAYSLNKQADRLTAIADAKINKLRATRNFAPVKRNVRARVTDQGWFGKGHPFPTFNQVIEEMADIPSHQFSCTDLDLLFSAFFVFGKVVSSQPDVIGMPATWQHVFTFADVQTSPEVIYTTLLEQIGDGSTPGYRRKLIGAWLSQFGLNGQMNDHVALSRQGAARAYKVEGVATLPAAPTAASFLITKRTKLSIGSPAAVNVDGKWSQFSIEVNQNPAPKSRSGQPVGEEKYVERADVGKQTVSGNVIVELSDTFRDFYLLDQDVALTIEMLSEDLTEAGGLTIGAKLEIPLLKVVSEDFSEDDKTTMLTLSLDEGSVLKKDAATAPVTLTVTTNIDNTELGVAA